MQVITTNPVRVLCQSAAQALTSQSSQKPLLPRGAVSAPWRSAPLPAVSSLLRCSADGTVPPAAPMHWDLLRVGHLPSGLRQWGAAGADWSGSTSMVGGVGCRLWTGCGWAPAPSQLAWCGSACCPSLSRGQTSNKTIMHDRYLRLYVAAHMRRMLLCVFDIK
jgi:hypothetical protein